MRKGAWGGATGVSSLESFGWACGSGQAVMNAATAYHRGDLLIANCLLHCLVVQVYLDEGGLGKRGGAEAHHHAATEENSRGRGHLGVLFAHLLVHWGDCAAWGV